jgi:hypothetical protein
MRGTWWDLVWEVGNGILNCPKIQASDKKLLASKMLSWMEPGQISGQIKKTPLKQELRHLSWNFTSCPKPRHQQILDKSIFWGSPHWRPLELSCSAEDRFFQTVPHLDASVGKRGKAAWEHEMGAAVSGAGGAEKEELTGA